MAHAPNIPHAPQPAQPSLPTAHNSFLNPNSLVAVKPDTDAVLKEPTLAVQNSISKTDQQQEALLSQLGPEAILELLSAGVILEEIALQYHIRIKVMHQWVLTNITQEDIHEAKKSAAALYRARAVRVVEESKNLKSTMKAAEVSYLKLMAEVYTDMSKAMDPAEWNPRPSAGGEDAPLSVTFNMMGNGQGAPTGVQTVVNGTAHEVNLSQAIPPTPPVPPEQSVEDVMMNIGNYAARDMSVPEEGTTDDAS